MSLLLFLNLFHYIIYTTIGFILERDKLEKIKKVVARNGGEVVTETPMENDVQLRVRVSPQDQESDEDWVGKPYKLTEEKIGTDYNWDWDRDFMVWTFHLDAKAKIAWKIKVTWTYETEVRG